jgi:hypothetical protein
VPSSVYTNRLALFASITSAESAIVPAGELWVVRCIDVSARDVSFGQGLYVTGSAGQLFYYALFEAPPASPWQQWTGTQVLYAGEGLTAHPSGTWDVTISGYTFTSS